ncbi:MAG TPA: hypothetical protein VGI74_00550 [Streptosporangiaceae bacterium]
MGGLTGAVFAADEALLPDLDRYEERYRLTGRAVFGLAVSLLVIGLGFFWHSPMILMVIAIVLGILIAQGAGAVDLARRRIAFRVDREGVALGAVPDKLTVRRGSPLFIPWTDVKSIILYQSSPQAKGNHVPVPCIGVQRKEGATPLLWGNEQAPGCPVPGVPTWATRRVVGWRLDHGRLAAVVAAVAPGVTIVDTAAPAVEPGQSAA